jgi:uncharacterized protein YukE
MKFDMGDTTLQQLTKNTSTLGQDLGTLVRSLADAAEPLESKFHGLGRQAFDTFKANTDAIATSLDAALAAVLAGIEGQEAAFATGDQSIADATTTTQNAQDFDAARFGAR